MTMIVNYCLDQLKSNRAADVTINFNDCRDHSLSVGIMVEDKDSFNWFEKFINQLAEPKIIAI